MGTCMETSVNPLLGLSSWCSNRMNASITGKWDEDELVQKSKDGIKKKQFGTEKQTLIDLLLSANFGLHVRQLPCPQILWLWTLRPTPLSLRIFHFNPFNICHFPQLFLLSSHACVFNVLHIASCSATSGLCVWSSGTCLQSRPRVLASSKGHFSYPLPILTTK